MQLQYGTCPLRQARLHLDVLWGHLWHSWSASQYSACSSAPALQCPCLRFTCHAAPRAPSPAALSPAPPARQVGARMPLAPVLRALRTGEEGGGTVLCGRVVLTPSLPEPYLAPLAFASPHLSGSTHCGIVDGGFTCITCEDNWVADNTGGCKCNTDAACASAPTQYCEASSGVCTLCSTHTARWCVKWDVCASLPLMSATELLVDDSCTAPG